MTAGKGWNGQAVEWRGTLVRSDGTITVGVCAREKKALSKQMVAITSRLTSKKFEVVVFGDKCILEDPVEEWPLCDCIIAFFSTGFPADKARAYIALRRPYELNSLEMVGVLHDRRRVYDLLRDLKVPTPENVYVSRDGYGGEVAHEQVIIEGDDSIQVGNVTLHKPFVEKPVDAEDHSVYIYYPVSAGGGSKRLFRKIGDRSSEFYPEVNAVRRDGSFIYEAFVETQGTDVKVYTVGPNYGHAEARKSPTLDGKVNRNAEGKEIRFPVILSSEEKEYASKITSAFRQCVCGFDILRVQGRSFVCDVNGWSFVKNSRKYTDDCAMLLEEFIEAAVKPGQKASLFSTETPLININYLPLHGPFKDHRRRHHSDTSSERGTGGGANRRAFVGGGGGGGGGGSTPWAGTGIFNQGSYGRDGLRLSVNGFAPGASHRVNSAPVSPTSSWGTASTGSRDWGGAQGPGASPAVLPLSPARDEEVPPGRRKRPEELRCIISITRHADRTPKQKMKFKISLPPFLEFYNKYSQGPRKELRIKGKHELKHFLAVTRDFLSSMSPGNSIDRDTFTKLRQIEHVLARWEISGINRKLQLKPQSWEPISVPRHRETDAAGTNGDQEKRQPESSEGKHVSPQLPRQSSSQQHTLPGSTLPHVDCVGGHAAGHCPLPGAPASDTPTPVSICSGAAGGARGKGGKTEEASHRQRGGEPVRTERVTKLLLILKWGGELTKLGERQARELGNSFRSILYPDMGCGGLLRLHSTFRHDLKIRTSDEGRVMNTAAAFAKGFLELEGELTPILVSLVSKDRGNKSGGVMMLDHTGNKHIKRDMDRCKDFLWYVLNQDATLSPEQIDTIVPAGQVSVRNALASLGNPVEKLRHMRALMADLVRQLAEKSEMADREEMLANTANNPKAGAASVTSNGTTPSLRPESTPSTSATAKATDCTPTSLIGVATAAAAATSISSSSHLAGEATRTPTEPTVGKVAVEGDKRSEHTTAASTEAGAPPGAVALPPKQRVTGGGNLGSSGGGSANGIPALRETPLLMLDRWRELHDELYDEVKGFDITKIPDVHDNARYECLHNAHLGLEGLPALYDVAKNLADCCVPQEYGVTPREKVVIGSKMCSALLDKIKYDLIIARSDNEVDMRYQLDLKNVQDLPLSSLGRRVRTRLYFTSESHLHTILNVLRFHVDGPAGCVVTEEAKRMLSRTKELCYLTTIVMRLFEDTGKNPDDPARFRVEVSFSPGVVKHALLEGEHLHAAPLVPLHKDLTCAQVEATLDAAIALAAQDHQSESADDRDKAADEIKLRFSDQLRRESAVPSCDTLDDPADQQPSPTSGILTEEEDDDEDHEAGGHEGEEEISLDEPLGDLDRELRKPARVTPRLASVAGGASDWWAVRKSRCVWCSVAAGAVAAVLGVFALVGSRQARFGHK